MKYNIDMQLYSPERNILHLFLFFIFASTLGWFVNSYPPELFWHFLGFYLLLEFTMTSLFLFIFCNIRQALLVSTGIIIFSILRSFNLRHPFYGALLILCLISIEYTFRKIRKTR